MAHVLFRQRWLMATIALTAGLLSAWAARHHIQGRIAQIEAELRVPTVPRLVAARDLDAGIHVEADHLAVRDIPELWAVSGSLPPEHVAEVSGSVLTHGLRAGEPLLVAHLTSAGPLALSRRVATGRRAITIPVDDINSLSGMLQAGDLLDLYVSFEHQHRRITAPLLQGVRVLATGRHAGREGEEHAPGAPDAPGALDVQGADGATYSTITLDAGPEDAVKLVAARQDGIITAILRHHRDEQPAPVAARGDLAGLLGVHAERPVPAVSILYGDQAGDEGLSEEDAARAAPGEFFDAPLPKGLVSRTRAAARATKGERP
ncbi:Flp pilus assembly protein CpaB [Bordetella sp. LUAb4]|uniref:Flp pilus assembly protein CpaB n=1 Tax=Bordetella sp. LUAb4 TaxID=2843195 RepID=UPI001E5750C3|nr:Flp pilus assembly protein CpaB [Bordetella sp. LUAb4]